MLRANNLKSTRRFTVLWAVFGLICVGYTALIVFFAATVPPPEGKLRPWAPCAIDGYYDYSRVLPLAVAAESEDTN